MKGMTMKMIPRISSKGPFFTRRTKLYSRPDGFVLYGKLGIDFLTTSELLYPNMKVRIRLIRARPNFYMISENPMLAWVLWFALCALGASCSKKTITKREVSTSWCSNRVQLHGNIGKDFYPSCTTESCHSRKYFQQRTYKSNSHCNEVKLCLYRLLCRESIVVLTV